MTSRPLSTYSPRYLRSKSSILAYRKRNKERYREYMCEYMTQYRQRPEYQVHKYRMYIRNYLLGRLQRSIISADLGLTRAEFAEKYNMSEAAFVAYVKARSVDHIVSYAYLKENHPAYLPFLHRWYNLQFITPTQNSRKGAWVDADDATVRSILAKMEAELKIKNTKL